MLLNDEENKPAPTFPPAVFAATVLAGAAFAYLAFFYVREVSVVGLHGESLRWAVNTAFGVFLLFASYGSWRRWRKPS